MKQSSDRTQSPPGGVSLRRRALLLGGLVFGVSLLGIGLFQWCASHHRK